MLLTIKDMEVDDDSYIGPGSGSGGKVRQMDLRDI